MGGMRSRSSVEKYHLLFLDLSVGWGISVLFSLLVIALGIALFILYGYGSNDIAPDSFAGYTYGIVGTFFMLLAALGYSRYRRSHKRRVGRLNGVLHWHVGFGVIALSFSLLHSLGNFNPRTGTYALYSLIALVVSGVIGRVLDRIVPKLIADAIKCRLTEYGKVRVPLHEPVIESTVSYGKQQLNSPDLQEGTTPSRVTRAKKPPMTAWDQISISPEEAPQGWGQNMTHHQSVSDRANNLRRPAAPLPDMQEDLEELPDALGTALHREEYYKAIIRYWRIGHVVLALVTLGLMLWHLEYAATLLFPMFFKSIGYSG